MKPLQPQSQDRIEYEMDVCLAMEIAGDMDTSDAQGQMMLKDTLVDECYQKGIPPVYAAELIIKACQVL
jgi:hypothetical protein